MAILTVYYACRSLVALGVLISPFLKMVNYQNIFLNKINLNTLTLLTNGVITNTWTKHE